MFPHLFHDLSQRVLFDVKHCTANILNFLLLELSEDFIINLFVRGRG